MPSGPTSTTYITGKCSASVDSTVRHSVYPLYRWAGQSAKSRKTVESKAGGATMYTRERWSRILSTVGYIGMLVGAIDPLEGSLVILPGSGLVALGTVIGRDGRRVLMYRTCVFVLIATGVGGLWGLSAWGGIGGSSGHSGWWGVLILPYVIGWFMGICGPGSPTWVLKLGIGVGVVYLLISLLILNRAAGQFGGVSALPGFAVAVVGVLTIGGCIMRLRHLRRSAQ